MAGSETLRRYGLWCLEAGAWKAVRDAVTRMHIRRNMIAWPATEPTNPKRLKSWALVFSKRAIYGGTGESGSTPTHSRGVRKEHGKGRIGNESS